MTFLVGKKICLYSKYPVSPELKHFRNRGKFPSVRRYDKTSRVGRKKPRSGSQKFLLHQIFQMRRPSHKSPRLPTAQNVHCSVRYSEAAASSPALRAEWCSSALQTVGAPQPRDVTTGGSSSPMRQTQKW